MKRKQFLISGILFTLFAFFQGSNVYAATPLPPVALKATVMNATNATSSRAVSVSLSWVNADPSVTSFGFSLYYGTTTGNGMPLYPTYGIYSGATSTFFSNIYASGTLPMYIGMTVGNATGNSPRVFSNAFVGGYTPSAPTLPAASSPTTQSTGQSVPVTVTWADTSNNESGFNITAYYANTQTVVKANGFMNLSVFVPANTTSYTFATTSPLTAVPATTTPLYFVVKAVNDYGESAGVQTPPITLITKPSAPAKVTASVMTIITTAKFGIPVKGNIASITWTPVSSKITGYILQRRNVTTSSSLPADLVLTLSASSINYMDKIVTASSTYIYDVKAVNGLESSAFTSSNTLTIPR